MIGAIVGDIIGSKYEFDNTFDYSFPLFGADSSYTDDTVCTIAIADAILNKISYKDSLLRWCRKYPSPVGGYGVSFLHWIFGNCHEPYGSYGNGSAMRVSPIGFAYNDEKQVYLEAIKSASCSHSHPEGIKGARVVAEIIRQLRMTHSKDVLYGIAEYEGYKIPPVGVFDETCQGCVPLAIALVKKSDDFEDAIRLAVSYGGDSDTVGAIVGGIAEALYGVPEEISVTAMQYLPEEMKYVIKQFEYRYGR